MSLEILVASDFDKVAWTAIYYLQYYYMQFSRIIGKVAGRSHGSNRRYLRPPPLVDITEWKQFQHYFHQQLAMANIIWLLKP